MYTQVQPTLASKGGLGSITSTRRRFMLAATAAAAAYSSMGTQAWQSFRPTLQTFLLSPFPQGYGRATSAILTDLHFMCWKLALKRRVDRACYSCMDIRNLPMA